MYVFTMHSVTQAMHSVNQFMHSIMMLLWRYKNIVDNKVYSGGVEGYVGHREKWRSAKEACGEVDQHESSS